ncbi:MAG: hypothetical protein ACD_39C01662G0002 [uncultured bacterium]|nr:MAG: hypothetical protein ACD_39C01662G0002 [uncultured bacterium]
MSFAVHLMVDHGLKFVILKVAERATMLRKINMLVFGVMLAIFMPAVFLHAQSINNLDLQFNRGLPQHRNSVPVPGNGEFKLSLGSQLFAEEDRQPQKQSSTEVSRIEIAENFSDFGNPNTALTRAQSPAQLKLRASKPADQRRFAPTITLSSAYEDNAIGPNDATANGLSIGRESGRLRVYGEFEQQHIATFNTQSERAFGGVASDNAIRASVIEHENSGQEKPEPHEKSAALASRYYLEAVYSFKPTLKGKVSFKRSMIDTFESEEKLQVEGIVEANRNVLIKAGYNNEVRPEVTDTKSSKDTKVWTEFILKF